MKYIFFSIVVFGVCCLWGCNKEEDLSPSNIDRNWFVLQDNPNDAVAHKCYELYEKWGIPIFYNDTIGREEQTDYFGNSFVNYEVLQLFYSASSYPSGIYSLFPQEDKNDLLPMLEMMDKVILPRLQKEMKITSILLVDTLKVAGLAIGSYADKQQYRGFNTWALKAVRQPGNMTEEEWEDYGINILIDLVKNKLNFSDFLAISNQFGAKYSETSDSKYSYALSSGSSNYTWGFPFGINVAEFFAGIRLEDENYQKETDLAYLNMPEGLCLETYGILKPLEGSPTENIPKYLWYIPKQQQDIDDYCKAVFEYSPSEFQTKYANYPWCLQKYEIVKKLFEDYGFKFE